MGKWNIWGIICRSLDQMEDELDSLRRCKRKKPCRKDECGPKESNCPLSAFCPTCGRGKSSCDK